MPYVPQGMTKRVYRFGELVKRTCFATVSQFSVLVGLSEMVLGSLGLSLSKNGSWDPNQFSIPLSHCKVPGL